MAAFGRSASGLAIRRLVVALAAAVGCFAPTEAAGAQGVTNPVAVINADGSGQRTVGQLPGDIPIPGPPGFYGPVQMRVPWSPDNREIAFLGPGPAIYALLVDGGTQRRLTPGTGFMPDWSPTAPLLAYVTDLPEAPIRITNTATGADSELVSAGSWPAFSPDGAKIAFERTESGSSGTNVWIVNTDGTGLTQLTTDNRSFLRNPPQPSWTRDGRIIFRSTATGTSAQYTMNPDGTGRAQYTPPWGNSQPGGNQILQGLLSPDGSRLASIQGVPGPGSMTRLHLANADGSGSVRVGPASQLHSWSPDGARLAFQPSPDFGDCVQGARSSFTLTRLRGRVLVRIRGRTRSLTRRPRSVANGVVVDARRGSVKLSVSRRVGCTGFDGAARFAGARVRLEPGPGQTGLLNRLRLIGALRGCDSGNGGRTLRVSARGPLYVNAQRLIAFNTSPRARYTVADTCDHTSLVKAYSGRVFADPHRRGAGAVRVKPGRRYVARRRG